MANIPNATTPATPQTDAPRKAAEHLEDAVKHNEDGLYTSAMAEVNAYLTKHPQEASSYTAAITKKLTDDGMLPRVSLFEAKHDFDAIDFTHSGGLTKVFIDKYRKQEGTNELQRNLLDNITPNKNPLLPKDAYEFKPYLPSGLGKDDIETALTIREQHREQLQHLFEKGPDNKSLYDSITNSDGNVPDGKFDSMTNLSQADKDSLQYLHEYAKRDWHWNKDMSGDEIKQACKENNLDFDQLRNQPPPAQQAAAGGPLDDRTRQAEAEKLKLADAEKAKLADAEKAKLADAEKAKLADAEKAKLADAEKAKLADAEKAKLADAEKAKLAADAEKAKLAEAEKAAQQKADFDRALTVKRGNSYAQSAEKLLDLAGVKDPTAQQLRHLTHQLWAADGHHRAYQLHAGHKIRIDDTIRGNHDLAPLFAVSKQPETIPLPPNVV